MSARDLALAQEHIVLGVIMAVLDCHGVLEDARGRLKLLQLVCKSWAKQVMRLVGTVQRLHVDLDRRDTKSPPAWLAQAQYLRVTGTPAEATSSSSLQRAETWGALRPLSMLLVKGAR